MVRGEGVRLYSSDGIEYLDAVSGTFNLPLGYHHPHVVGAVRRQLNLLSHVSSDLARPYAKHLIDRLLALAPPRIGAGWVRDATGSTAVECAIKIAQKATGKSDVVSLFQGHHGQTVLTTSLSGAGWRRRNFPAPSLAGVLRAPAPNCAACFYDQTYPSCELLCARRIGDLVRHAGRESTACLVVEPVLGNGGNIVPPEGYFGAVRQVCDELGMLLIVDEVQTGVGRTGFFTASETFAIQPDIIVLAKGLGGVGLPIGAVLMRPELDVLEPSEHSFTGGGNLLALAAAEATLDIVSDDSFLADVRRRGGLLGELLSAALSPQARVGNIRGVGLMWGVELVDEAGRPDPQLARAVVSMGLARQRFITRSSEYGRGHVIKIRPALIASDDDLVAIVARLSESIREAVGVEYARTGV